MIKGNDMAYPEPLREDNKYYLEGTKKGVDIRTYIATHSSVTWNDAQWRFNSCYKKNGSIQEIADLLAEMQIAAADALIRALNQPTTTAP